MIPYLILIIVVIILSEIKYKNFFFLRSLALFFLLIFVGFRYDVGADYLSYEQIFNDACQSSFSEFLIEPGYMLINHLVLFFTNNFYWLTTLIVAIQLFFFHKAIKDFEYYTFALFVFITMNLGAMVNEMRQYIAILIFLYSLKFIYNRSFSKYLALIIFGACFHYSILFILPLYFLLNRKLSYYLYPLVFVISFIVSKIGVFDKLFYYLIGFSPYSVFMETDLIEKVNTESGLGFQFKNLLGILILMNYKVILEKYPKYIVYMNLYLCFLVCRNLFFNIGILMRLNLYFQISEIIAYPLFIYALFKKDMQVEVIVLFSILLMSLFFIGIVNENYHLTYQTIFNN